MEQKLASRHSRQRADIWSLQTRFSRTLAEQIWPYFVQYHLCSSYEEYSSMWPARTNDWYKQHNHFLLRKSKDSTCLPSSWHLHWQHISWIPLCLEMCLQWPDVPFLPQMSGWWDSENTLLTRVTTPYNTTDKVTGTVAPWVHHSNVRELTGWVALCLCSWSL